MSTSPKLTVGDVIKSTKGVNKAPKQSKEALEKAKADRAKRHLYRGIQMGVVPLDREPAFDNLCLAQLQEYSLDELCDGKYRTGAGHYTFYRDGDVIIPIKRNEVTRNPEIGIRVSCDYSSRTNLIKSVYDMYCRQGIIKPLTSVVDLGDIFPTDCDMEWYTGESHTLRVRTHNAWKWFCMVADGNGVVTGVLETPSDSTIDALLSERYCTINGIQCSDGISPETLVNQMLGLYPMSDEEPNIHNRFKTSAGRGVRTYNELTDEFETFQALGMEATNIHRIHKVNTCDWLGDVYQTNLGYYADGFTIIRGAHKHKMSQRFLFRANLKWYLVLSGHEHMEITKEEGEFLRDCSDSVFLWYTQYLYSRKIGCKIPEDITPAITTCNGSCNDYGVVVDGVIWFNNHATEVVWHDEMVIVERTNDGTYAYYMNEYTELMYEHVYTGKDFSMYYVNIMRRLIEFGIQSSVSSILDYARGLNVDVTRLCEKALRNFAKQCDTSPKSNITSTQLISPDGVVIDFPTEKPDSDWYIQKWIRKNWFDIPEVRCVTQAITHIKFDVGYCLKQVVHLPKIEGIPTETLMSRAGASAGVTTEGDISFVYPAGKADNITLRGGYETYTFVDGDIVYANGKRHDRVISVADAMMYVRKYHATSFLTGETIVVPYESTQLTLGDTNVYFHYDNFDAYGFSNVVGFNANTLDIKFQSTPEVNKFTINGAVDIIAWKSEVYKSLTISVDDVSIDILKEADTWEVQRHINKLMMMLEKSKG